MVEVSKERPALLEEADISWIHDILRNGKVVSRPKGDFTPLGIFEVLDKSSSPRERIRDYLWSWELLSYNPRSYRLEAGRQGDLLVLNQRSRVITVIPPYKIRIVDQLLSYTGIVRESGYILKEHNYLISNGEQRSVSVSDIEEILLKVEKEIKPPAFNKKSYARVNSDLAGREFVVLVFGFSFAENRQLWERDGVVIDPESRRLVSSIISQPLVSQLL